MGNASTGDDGTGMKELLSPYHKTDPHDILPSSQTFSLSTLCIHIPIVLPQLSELSTFS